MQQYLGDISTPTEQDLDSCYGSKYLSAADLGDRKIKAKLADIRKVQMRQDNGASRVKFVLFFDGIDKGVVLNQTNKTVLVDALGRNPASWIGRQSVWRPISSIRRQDGARTEGPRAAQAGCIIGASAGTQADARRRRNTLAC